MDKILTKKIIGLKVEDILKCVLLVGVGYCIAVMLGNCNCVEGLPFVCENTGPAKCTVEDCNADADNYCSQETCPGWQIDTTGFHGPDPVIYTPSLLYTCVNQDGSGEGYGSLEECNTNKPTVPVYSPRRPPCPNPDYSPPSPPPTPPPIPQTIVCENGSCNQYPTSEAADKTGNKINCIQVIDKIFCGQAKADCAKKCNTPSPPTPPPPPPPPPPPTPSDCTYSGDSKVGPTPTSFNQQWWKESDSRCGTCDTDINNCRKEMKNYLKYVRGVPSDKMISEYNGFCIQTVGGGENGERGDCGRIQLTTDLIHENSPTCKTLPNSNACIDGEGQPIFITDPANVIGGADTCKSHRAGDTFANMAWVEDSLDLQSPNYQCNANCPNQDDCPTSNTFTPPTTFRAGGREIINNIEGRLGIPV